VCSKYQAKIADFSPRIHCILFPPEPDTSLRSSSHATRLKQMVGNVRPAILHAVADLPLQADGKGGA
jgi:hypothetical protein